MLILRRLCRRSRAYRDPACRARSNGAGSPRPAPCRRRLPPEQVQGLAELAVPGAEAQRAPLEPSDLEGGIERQLGDGGRIGRFQLHRGLADRMDRHPSRPVGRGHGPARELSEALLQLRGGPGLDGRAPGRRAEALGADDGPRRLGVVDEVRPELAGLVGHGHDVVLRTAGREGEFPQRAVAQVGTAGVERVLRHDPRTELPGAPAQGLGVELVGRLGPR